MQSRHPSSQTGPGGGPNGWVSPALTKHFPQTKLPGVGFVKIHAPWAVLCREAEFLKLKMPTKKVSPGPAGPPDWWGGHRHGPSFGP